MAYPNPNSGTWGTVRMMQGQKYYVQTNACTQGCGNVSPWVSDRASRLKAGMCIESLVCAKKKKRYKWSSLPKEESDFFMLARYAHNLSKINRTMHWMIQKFETLSTTVELITNLCDGSSRSVRTEVVKSVVPKSNMARCTASHISSCEDKVKHWFRWKALGEGISTMV